jgi:dTMP kinase
MEEATTGIPAKSGPWWWKWTPEKDTIIFSGKGWAANAESLPLWRRRQSMKKNVFIALEGIDGSGKSTQARLLASKLEALGQRVHLTCEPTTGPIGRMIRDIFAGRMQADQHTIAALFVADRMEHILHPTEGLLRLLADGYTVITDRYYFSSYAYHSVHVPMDWVIQSNARAAELLRPDITLYIDISPEQAMQRIQSGRSSTELYETLDNLRLTHAKYEEAFMRIGSAERVRRISGEASEEVVAQTVWQVVQDILSTQTGV